jgi:ATP adenylyltransferase
MDYLWTPWRYHYVTGASTADQPGDCIFCTAARSASDKDTLVVYRATHNFVILNRFPYTCGHVMVVPYAHVASLELLEEAGAFELMRLTRECERHLRALYEPDGLNIGMNIGKSAGAGVAGHIHQHVLPRWTGDANFLTSIAETRILPEPLNVTWERLIRAFTS